jgi:hypothetical protein
MAASKIERVRHPAREGQCHQREGKDEALGEKGDHASVFVVRGLTAAGMAPMVRGVGGAGMMAVQPFVKLRARGEDRKGQHQDDPKGRDDPHEERLADPFLAGHRP